MDAKTSKDYSKDLEQAQKEYDRSIREKLLAIQCLIECFQQCRDEKSYQTLICCLHKLGGSAGCYGYHKASELCKKMRDSLQENRSIQAQALASFFEKLKAAFR